MDPLKTYTIEIEYPTDQAEPSRLALYPGEDWLGGAHTHLVVSMLTSTEVASVVKRLRELADTLETWDGYLPPRELLTAASETPTN